MNPYELAGTELPEVHREQILKICEVVLNAPKDEEWDGTTEYDWARHGFENAARQIQLGIREYFNYLDGGLDGIG